MITVWGAVAIYHVLFFSSAGVSKQGWSVPYSSFLTFSGEFAESGSFIGQYGQNKLPTPLTAAGVATIV